MRLRAAARVTGPLLAALALGACAAGSTQGPPSVCTAVFTYISLAVVNPNGTPATDAVIYDTIPRTGVNFAMAQDSALVGTGTYDIFDDNRLSAIRHTGDSVLVTGVHAPKRFSAMFYIDAPDGCHVRKVAGPDTVTLQ